MKRISPFAVALTFAFVFLCAKARARDMVWFDADRATAKITHLDFIKSANDAFNARVAEINEKIAEEQKALEAMRQKIQLFRNQNKLSEASALEAEHNGRKLLLEKDLNRYAEEIAQKRLEARDIIEEQMLFLIEEMATEENFLLVFEKTGQIILSNSDYDITDEIVARYIARFDSLKSPYAEGVKRPLREEIISPTEESITTEEPVAPEEPIAPPPPAVELAEEKPSPTPVKADLPAKAGISEALRALGWRFFNDGDVSKAVRVWREMLSRASAPIYAVSKAPVCDIGAVKKDTEKILFFAEENGCLRAILRIYGEKSEAEKEKISETEIIQIR